MFRTVNRLASYCPKYRRNDNEIKHYVREFFCASLPPNSQCFRQYSSNHSVSKITYISDHHLEAFRKMGKNIMDELLGYNGYTGEYHPSLMETIPWMAARLRKLMEENVNFWEYARPMIIVRLYEEFVKYENNGNYTAITEEEYRKIYAMGWCFLLFEGFSVLSDDVVDNADIRMGRATWYRRNNNHVVAIYDQFFLSNAARLLANKYFAGEPYYYNIQKILTNSEVHYLWGMMTDVSAAESQDSQKRMDKYSWDLYKRLVLYNASIYISEPLKLAMHMVDKYDEKTASQIDQICYIFGIIFQGLDDYLDSYGEVQQKEKSCNDIAQGKYSFLGVLAYKYADQHQRNILLENYGKNNPHSVATVKDIYRQLDLPSKFQQRLKLMFRQMEDKIAKVDNEAVRTVLNLITSSIYDWHH